MGVAELLRGLRALLVVAFALVVGLFGLSLLFADLGPGESLAGRFALLLAMVGIASVGIGVVEPRRWLLAGLTTWGALLLGATGLVSVLTGRVEARQIGETLAALVLPLGVALAGGRLGAALRLRWARG